VETVGAAGAVHECRIFTLGHTGLFYRGLQLLAARPQRGGHPGLPVRQLRQILRRFLLPKILIRTIRISFETVILCVVMGYIPAYYFYRSESRYKKVFLLLIMLPFWVSFIIRTMSWINIMGDSGLINHFLLKIGLIERPHIHAVQ
jgi:ABC-type spermidine/putrescine transport system permease subunit I